jgi:hypothetical protein
MTRPPVPPFDEGQWWRSHPYHRIATKLSIFAATGHEPEVTLALKCKKGGFATFGFADQGSRVSHVNGTAKKGT